jgi:hypothetical protein
MRVAVALVVLGALGTFLFLVGRAGLQALQLI